MCAPDISKNLQSKKIDRVESKPLDVYGLENLTTVTKINLRARYACMLIMSDPWLNNYTEWLLPVNWQQRFFVEIAAAAS